MTTPAKRDPQSLLADLLGAAKKAGADAADALFVEAISSSVSYRLGKLEDVERAESAIWACACLSARESRLFPPAIFPLMRWPPCQPAP